MYVTLNGSPGGTFSSSSGLMLNTTTGSFTTIGSGLGTYTVSYTIPAAGGCPSVSSSTSVTILETPVVNGLPNVAVCSGTTVSIPGFTGSMNGLAYTWTNDNPSIGLAASGSGNIASFTATNSSNDPQVAHIKVMATYNSGGATCMSKPMSFAIFVNPVPAVAQMGNAVYCNGSTVPTTTFTGPTTGDGVRYFWTSNNTAIGMRSNGTDMIPSFTATNTTNAPISATVTVTPYFIRGSRCPGSPMSYTITVNPTLPGSASFDYGATPYCNNAGTVTPTFTGTSGGTFTSTAGLSINAATGAVNTGASTPGTYTVSYTVNNAGGCAEVNTATITIDAASAAISYPGTATYCTSTTTIAPTVTGTTGGTFSAPAGLSINPATGVIDLSTSTTGEYTVTYSANTSNCGTVVTTTIVRVILTPTVNGQPNQAICSGGSTAPVNFISNDPGASFVWTNSNTAIGLAAGGHGDIAPFTPANNTAAPLTARILVTPEITRFGSTCVGRPIAFNIVVNPTPVVTAIANQPVCVGQATAPITFSSTVNNNVTYSWTNSNTSIGLASSGTGNIPSFTPTSAGNASIAVRAIYHGSSVCTSSPIGFAIQAAVCGNTPVGTGGGGSTGRFATAQDQFESQVTAAPNPVANTLKVAYSGSEGPLTVRLLDLYGQPLKVDRSFSTSTLIDMSSLRPGNYVLQVIDEQRKLTVQRNIIKL
ncbi:hypothetical protein GCM10028786_08700 [Flaviaesturariibacter terrae]